MSRVNMYYAEMQTEHYTWRAIASDRETAVEAIKRGWRQHAENTLKRTGRALGVKVTELEDHYGINVLVMPLNACLMDEYVIAQP